MMTGAGRAGLGMKLVMVAGVSGASSHRQGQGVDENHPLTVFQAWFRCPAIRFHKSAIGFSDPDSGVIPRSRELAPLETCPGGSLPEMA